MLSSPTPDQVRSIAPDPGAARAGEALANRRNWTATGRDARGAWGLCQGSGASPYQTIVDFAGPAYKCSCPSRKFPCKHALGLLFLLAADEAAFTGATDPPAWASEWLASRGQRAERAEAKTPAGEPRAAEPDPAARAKRVQARERKVDAGLSDLDRWLQDLVRRGLAAAKSEGYAFWDEAGARLVDAQAASLGREVRALGAVANSGANWADGALERVARLHLIVEAYRRLETLPEDLRADVRSLVGWTIKEDELPPDGTVSDRWLALGRTVRLDDRLSTARTWLLGETSGRFALHLAFGAGGVNPAPVAMPGSSFQGDLVYYPSATPMRVAIGHLGEAGPVVTELPATSTIGDAAGTFAGILARNPFVTSWPVIIGDVVVVGRGSEMLLRDGSAATIRATPDALAARLLALAGGHPVTVFGLWSGRSIRVLSAIADGRLVDLGTESGDDGGSDGPSATAPAASDGSPWRRLVSAALLGTERSDAPDVDLAPLVAGVAVRAAESRLLGSAAILVTSDRAGWQPPTDDAPLPAPAEPDERPQVGAPAAWLLRLALEERLDLVPEWLGLAATARRRPPNDELPRLLGLASRNPVARRALAPVLSQRATWLVAQLPELAPGMTGPTGDPSVAWDAASSALDRAVVVAALRATDPKAGRDLLDAVWESATTDERALSIAALGEGLSADDIALLERGWIDSRAEVRSAAIDLLARLPGSAFARLADETARPTLEQAGRFRPSLQVTPPAAWNDALARLGIPKKPPQGTGERAWWLRHLLGRVAPERWEKWLAADPAALVDRALRSDESRGILEGWVEATIRTRNSAWATALLAHKEIAFGQAVPNVDSLALLDALSLSERDPVAARIVGMGDTEAAMKVAEHCPGPWSSLLSWAILNALARESQGGTISRAFVDLVRISVHRLPPEHADQLETIVAAEGSRLGAYPIFRDHLDVIDFRKRMRAAFAAEEASR